MENAPRLNPRSEVTGSMKKPNETDPAIIALIIRQTQTAVFLYSFPTAAPFDFQIYKKKYICLPKLTICAALQYASSRFVGFSTNLKNPHAKNGSELSLTKK